jgi:hypothetical protein
MTILNQIAQSRDWAEDERIVLKQVQRVADEVIEPNAAAFD